MAFHMSTASSSSEKWYYEAHKPLQWSKNDFYHYRHTKNFQPEESVDDFHNIGFDSIVHATHTDNKNLILTDADPEFAHFKAHPKIGYENDGRLNGRNFLWFSPYIFHEEIQKIRFRMYELIFNNMWDRLPESSKAGGDRLVEIAEDYNYPTDVVQSTIEDRSKDYGKSPAMRMGESRYGTHGFIIPLATLLKSMAVHHGVGVQDLTFYDMGTFSYIHEQMHTVLICPREDLSFKPMLDDSKIFCRPKSEDDKYQWLARATRQFARLPSSAVTDLCDWEHLSFACLLQPDQELLIPRNEIQYKLLKHNQKKCIPAKRTATGMCPDLFKDNEIDGDPLQDITTTLQTTTSKRTIDEVE